MMIINRLNWFVYVLLVVLPPILSAEAGDRVDREFPGAGYAHSDRRDFYVYIPESYDGQNQVPMVMVLHGCHQSRNTIFDEFGWDELAERHGFIVVAPDISTNDLMRNPKCWGYWEEMEIHQGAGEVEDLHSIGLQVEQEWRIDPDHRHITGLSSGGFMANAAAIAHNEYWASAGVHSGGGYSETASTYSLTCANPRESSGVFRSPTEIVADMRDELDDAYGIPVMLIHSINDCSVGYGVEGDPGQWGGLTANREAWRAVNGGSLAATSDCSRDGIDCRHKKFGTVTRSTVEVVRLEGMIQDTDAGKGHYWSGGKHDGQWTKSRGPRAAALFWDFFRRHPRLDCDGCPATPRGLRVTRIGHRDVTLSWDPNSETDIIRYRLYRNDRPVASDPIPDPTYSDSDLRPGETVTYVVKAVNEEHIESLGSAPLTVQTHDRPGCRSYHHTVAAHVAHGRAYADERCRHWWCWLWPWPTTTGYYAKGSGDYLSNDGSARVILYTMDDDHFGTSGCDVLE